MVVERVMHTSAVWFYVRTTRPADRIGQYVVVVSVVLLAVL
jgi:hypothetical protein